MLGGVSTARSRPRRRDRYRVSSRQELCHLHTEEPEAAEAAWLGRSLLSPAIPAEWREDSFSTLMDCRDGTLPRCVPRGIFVEELLGRLHVG